MLTTLDSVPNVVSQCFGLFRECESRNTSGEFEMIGGRTSKLDREDDSNKLWFIFPADMGRFSNATGGWSSGMSTKDRENFEDRLDPAERDARGC